MFKFSLCRVWENALSGIFSGIVLVIISWALFYFNILPKVEENKLRIESLAEILQERNPEIPYRSMLDYGVENKIPPQELENSYKNQQVESKMKYEKK